ncbi:hypothetical protein DYB25_003678, partial [Aphanomyces astaci]
IGGKNRVLKCSYEYNPVTSAERQRHRSDAKASNPVTNKSPTPNAGVMAEIVLGNVMMPAPSMAHKMPTYDEKTEPWLLVFVDVGDLD